jgi:hypothetical protein
MYKPIVNKSKIIKKFQKNIILYLTNDLTQKIELKKRLQKLEI